MEPVKKLYAAITAAGFNRGPTVEIADEKDAVQKTLSARGIAFNVYEVTSVTVGGKEMKGDPENHSPRRYVGIDRLYTRDEVVTEMETPVRGGVPGHPEMDRMMENAMKSVAAHFRKDPADSAYITGLERPGEYIRLSAGEKVFNRKGEQLWPKPSVPATPAVKAAPPKPSDKKRWTLKP